MCDGEGINDVGQLVIEIHFQFNLGIRNDSDLRTIARVANCLQQRGWYMTTYQAAGSGPLNWDFAPRLLEALPSPAHLMHTSFRSLAPGEKTNAELWQDVAT